MARYARMLDKPDRRGRFRHASPAQVKAAFQKRFFKPASGMYDNGTQTSSILPLAFGMVPDGEPRARCSTSLVRKIEQESRRPRRHRAWWARSG